MGKKAANTHLASAAASPHHSVHVHVKLDISDDTFVEVHTFLQVRESGWLISPQKHFFNLKTEFHLLVQTAAYLLLHERSRAQPRRC